MSLSFVNGRLIRRWYDELGDDMTMETLFGLACLLGVSIWSMRLRNPVAGVGAT